MPGLPALSLRRANFMEALMPSRPPSLKPTAKRPAFNRPRKQTTTERGYGWAHQQMRERVLAEEPACRACWNMMPRRYTASAIADHITPLAEGGTGDRENYQGLCIPCHDSKSLAEAARGQGRTK